jgi:hypothetical protein
MPFLRCWQARRHKTPSTKYLTQPLRFELLEDRLALTTTLFLDFGTGIGVGNVLNSTAGAIRNIDGVGTYGFGTGADLTQNSNPALRLQAASSVDIRPLFYDFDLDGAINNADVAALSLAVVPLIERALEPFDINVVIASANAIPTIVNSLAANDNRIDGRMTHMS